MRGGRAQRGFTLVEIVVAFVLLTLVLATSYQIFTAGLQRAGDLEDYSRALEIAQTQLANASLGETFEEGQVSGQSDDQRFQWTLTTAAYDDGTDPAKRVLQAQYGVLIAVRVTWRNGMDLEKSLDLATITIGRTS
jgi:general secretion pathway protein I